jgi:murein DD-endopeptidase MepM/ murein hydrolase activator NlpD
VRVFFHPALALAIAFIFVVLPEAPAASNDTSKWPPGWTVESLPGSLINGSVLLVKVSAPEHLSSLSGTWLGHDVAFNPNASGTLWTGLAGIGLDVKPGVFTLQLTAKDDAGKSLALAKKLTVGRAHYKTVSVTVPAKYTAPTPEQLEEIARDKKIKQEAFAHATPERFWSGGFLPPATVPVSGEFGTRRVFNGKVQSVHEGLDFAAPAGTEVVASNRGSILLARQLYFEGNCVVIDHGQGLLTLYLHLSSIQVKEGEQVSRGQRIGLSGNTGRSTGPHLHLAVRWQGEYLDPATLLQLKFP